MEKTRVPRGLRILWATVAALLIGGFLLGLLDDGTIDGPWGWAPNNVGLKLHSWPDILGLVLIAVVPTLVWWLCKLCQRRSGS
jgi:hypothetical protein